ncbi:YTH domain-containing protein [Artemisia annua]|uniref:YTH domain-containing protein n=1 Tax=Artemisia annua TaxID=35608 RepID=A0A2U1N3S1_ARTAN|nr:YTH domain-containing protein [Artemisia annua]
MKIIYISYGYVNSSTRFSFHPPKENLSSISTLLFLDFTFTTIHKQKPIIFYRFIKNDCGLKSCLLKVNALSVDTTGNGNKGPMRPTVYQNSAFNSNGSYNRGTQSLYQDPRYGFDGVHSRLPWIDSSVYSNRMPRNNTNTTPLSNANGFASKNQNFRTKSHLVSPRPMSGINAAIVNDRRQLNLAAGQKGAGSFSVLCLVETPGGEFRGSTQFRLLLPSDVFPIGVEGRFYATRQNQSLNLALELISSVGKTHFQ